LSVVCYQGDNATMHTIMDKDPVDPCQYKKHQSDLVPGNCSGFGYTKFIAYDPIFRQAQLWRRPLLSEETSAKATVTASFAVDTDHTLTLVSQSFIGVNIDSASLYQGTPPHRLNFADPSLRVLASRLAPNTTLRIGGSSAEDLGWGSHTGQIIEVDTAYWDTIADFTAAAGLKLVWDLNSEMRGPNNIWNSSNAEAMLRYIHAHPAQRGVLRALQLGNEPGHSLDNCDPSLQRCISAEQHGADFGQLRELLQKVFGADRPLIQGPDVCFGKGIPARSGGVGGQKCANLTYFGSVLEAAAGSIDEVTVHHYGLQGPPKSPGGATQCTLDAFLAPGSWEDSTAEILRGWQSIQGQVSAGSKLILSETATTGDGGCPELSNTFAAGFFWVHDLGIAAQLGYWQVFRQDLVGFSGMNGTSSYSLAGAPGWVGAPSNAEYPNRTVALTPNPDFFTTVLWQRLVGHKVLNVTTILGSPTHVRMHAACARARSGTHSGDITLAFANSARTSMQLRLDLPGVVSHTDYILTAPENKLAGRTMLLNGLVLADATSPLHGVEVKEWNNGLEVPPFSYGFSVLHGGTARACM